MLIAVNPLPLHFFLPETKVLFFHTTFSYCGMWVHIFVSGQEVEPAVDGAWIVADNPKYLPNLDLEQKMVELFLIEETQVDVLISRIADVRGAIRVLCELTATLLKRGVIW